MTSIADISRCVAIWEMTRNHFIKAHDFCGKAAQTVSIIELAHFVTSIIVSELQKQYILILNMGALGIHTMT